MYSIVITKLFQLFFGKKTLVVAKRERDGQDSRL